LLLTDPARAAAMGHAARLAVEEQYSIPALRQQLRKLLAAVRANSAPAGSSNA
jgi:glycosyltransferase involved in cell wall biosynthesis